MAKDNIIKVAACGFDAIGFTTPMTILSEGNIRIELIAASHIGIALDKYDGAIIPSGAYERIIRGTSIYGDTWDKVEYNPQWIAHREREVINMIKDGKWVCFLLGHVEKTFQQGHDFYEIDNTDLCKKIMNLFGISWQPTELDSRLHSMANEFHKYVEAFGVSQTNIHMPSKKAKPLVLNSNNATVGLQEGNQLFLLPFQSADKSANVVKNAAEQISKAIIDYRRKNVVVIPEWLNEIKLEEEKRAEARVEIILKDLHDTTNRLEQIKLIKSILTTSGEHLVTAVEFILTDFFGFILDSHDEGKEDLKILNDDKTLFAICEVKGKNTGVKGEHVNQVDTHRERNNLDATTPGLLIINDSMDVDGLSQRRKISVHGDHIKKAENLNIVILRSIDFFYMILSLETKSVPERKKDFISLVSKGGGAIYADEKEVKLLTTY